MKFENLGRAVQEKIGEWIEILDPYKNGEEEIPIRERGGQILITVPISWGKVIVKLDPTKLS